MWSEQKNTESTNGTKVVHGCIYMSTGPAFFLRDSFGNEWQVRGSSKTLRNYAGMEVNVSAKAAAENTHNGALSISVPGHPTDTMQITNVQVVQECLVDPYGFLHR